MRRQELTDIRTRIYQIDPVSPTALAHAAKYIAILLTHIIEAEYLLDDDNR